MNTFDVPTVNLVHSKINGDKLKAAQERAERVISRKRKHEDGEFEAQMMEQESLVQELESLVSDETQNIEVYNKEMQTEHQGDLPFDFFGKGYVFYQ